MSILKTLYKIDTNGKTREWLMQVDGDRYRTIAGLQDGKKVTSGWTIAEPKNVGKSNATTAVEQAQVEADAEYKKKLRGEYSSDANTKGELEYFKPMLAVSYDKRIDKITFPCFVQPKLDGIRCIFTKDGPKSRTGKPIVTIPHIEKALAPIFDKYPDLVIDGELYNHELKDNFNEIVSLVRKTKPSEDDLIKSEEMVEYHIYDFPSDDMFSNRFLRCKLQHLSAITCIKIVVTKEISATKRHELDIAYEEYLFEGYEGGIIRLDAPYEQKRSNNLLKRKDFEDEEFKIIRIEEGLGNWSGCAKRVIFQNNDESGTECGAGLAGTKEYAQEVLLDKNNYVGKQATIQYFTRTPDGIPRFPIAKVLHKDKRW